ncbi:TPA: hypothetical protein RQK90_000916 [Vibrio vulnificus]|nr:hypothetical protein [Vibrio vulnificus]
MGVLFCLSFFYSNQRRVGYLFHKCIGIGKQKRAEKGKKRGGTEFVRKPDKERAAALPFVMII